MTRRRVNTQRTAALPCPRPMADGCPCEADVDVVLDYEPADRSIGEQGGYTVQDVAARCADGHDLTDAEYAQLQTQADRVAREYTWDRDFDAREAAR